MQDHVYGRVREARAISPPPTKRARSDDGPSQFDDHARLTVYSWNVNGIQPFTQNPITAFFQATKSLSSIDTPTSTLLESTLLRDFLRRHSFPTCLFLQEVKINPTDTATQRAVQSAISAPKGSSEPDYEAFFCLPTDKFNARGFGRKVYGVCSIVRRDFRRATSATVRTVDWDCEGRFQILETAGKDKLYPKLCVWNIYAVNGTDYAYKDPETGQLVGTRHDRKLQVHDLMLKDCQDLERQGYSVILAGDLNIARGPLDGHPNLRVFPEQHVRNRADFNQKFFKDPHGLLGIDTFRHLFPDARRYTYHPRGVRFGDSCDRVDLIICSRRLLTNNALIDAGILDSEVERATSDHCPLWATFSFGPEQEESQ